MISHFRRTFKIFRIALSNTTSTCHMRLGALETWLVQTEMCYKCKMHTNFENFVRK